MEGTTAQRRGDGLLKRIQNRRRRLGRILSKELLEVITATKKNQTEPSGIPFLSLSVSPAVVKSNYKLKMMKIKKIH